MGGAEASATPAEPPGGGSGAEGVNGLSDRRSMAWSAAHVAELTPGTGSARISGLTVEIRPWASNQFNCRLAAAERPFRWRQCND